jgi:hypothetical protein
MSQNIPPFYVGQEVICLIDAPDFGLKKGTEKIIMGIQKPCCSWMVDVGLTIPRGEVCVCVRCNHEMPESTIVWGAAECWKPKDQMKAASFTKVMETELVSEN